YDGGHAGGMLAVRGHLPYGSGICYGFFLLAATAAANQQQREPYDDECFHLPDILWDGYRHNEFRCAGYSDLHDFIYAPFSVNGNVDEVNARRGIPSVPGYLVVSGGHLFFRPLVDHLIGRIVYGYFQ